MPVVVFESVFVLTVWADSRKVSKHQCTFYLFESFHLAGELAMDEKKRESVGNTIRHLRQVVKRCICLIQAHTHTHTAKRLEHQAHTLESGQKCNSQTCDRSTIKQVSDCRDENVASESNLATAVRDKS